MVLFGAFLQSHDLQTSPPTVIEHVIVREKSVDEWAELLQQDYCLSEEEYLEAIKVFERVRETSETMELHEFASICNLYLAEAYLHIGETQKSSRCLAKSEESDFIDIQMASACLSEDRNKALALLRQAEGCDDRIPALLQKLIQAEPMFDEVDLPYISCVQSYFREGDYEAAIEVASSTNFEERLYHAAALALQGRVEESIQCYTLLIDKEAEWQRRGFRELLYIERGLVYLLLGDQEAALTDLAKAQDIELPYYFTRNEPMFLPISTYIIEWVLPGSAARKEAILQMLKEGKQYGRKRWLAKQKDLLDIYMWYFFSIRGDVRVATLILKLLDQDVFSPLEGARRYRGNRGCPEEFLFRKYDEVVALYQSTPKEYDKEFWQWYLTGPWYAAVCAIRGDLENALTIYNGCIEYCSSPKTERFYPSPLLDLLIERAIIHEMMGHRELALADLEKAQEYTSSAKEIILFLDGCFN